MNFWHMQMHSGSRPDFKVSTILDILKTKKVIGFSESKDDSLVLKQFTQEMSLGDVVVIKKGKKPIALVLVSGKPYESAQVDADFDWFQHRRTIEILDTYQPEYKFSIPQTRGTLSKCVDLNSPTSKVIVDWYKRTKDKKTQKNITPELIQKIVDDLQIKYLKLINDIDFYFQHGRDELLNWQDYDLSNIDNKELVKLTENYQQLLKVAKKNKDINEILTQINKVIAYCDSHAKDKRIHNKYEDFRVLAKAFVRQNNWVESLVKYKLEGYAISSDSIQNAINYLSNPVENITILSEDHRKLISKKLLGLDYQTNSFVQQLKDYYKPFIKFKFKNEENQTQFLALLTYELRAYWDSSRNNETTKESNEMTAQNIHKVPLNQILFGPPGTGKTYSTIIKSLSIIEQMPETLIQEENFKELKSRFDECVKKGQIVFTTFHQSMTYEDFIEGIKPQVDGSKVTYDVIDGLFKKMCIQAARKEINDFDKSYDKFIKDFFESGEQYLKLNTKTKKSFWVSVNSNGNLGLYTTDSKNHQGSLTKEKLKLHSTDDTTFKGWEGYANAIIDELKNKYGLTNKKIDQSKKNFILIIDEINRGNVSAVFGELITLIEESKRQGNDEALKVTLPYSKDSFSVPKNLHIIGTMNTADRSVEALDSALRRRFSFTEMPPTPELIETAGNKIRYIESHGEEIDLIDLLNVINDRLEVLLDKDHLIGHSYFMKVTDLESLQDAFYNEIIPLLQEYFFGDYGKITMVLGEGFCGVKEDKNKIEFANVPDAYDKPDYDDKLIFEIKRVESKKFINAINLLLLKPNED